MLFRPIAAGKELRLRSLVHITLAIDTYRPQKLVSFFSEYQKNIDWLKYKTLKIFAAVPVRGLSPALASQGQKASRLWQSSVCVCVCVYAANVYNTRVLGQEIH